MPLSPLPTDELYENYLQKAITEINELGDEIQKAAGSEQIPVLGSGHPLGDIFLLKYAPTASEIEEGVAFYGRAGSALMKSFKRLGIDPLTVYGTLCVKCPVPDTEQSAPECRARVLEELAIVQPRIVVVMGEAALAELMDLDVPLGRPVDPEPGRVQKLTPSCDALFVPDIDQALDDEGSKREFWAAFRALGDWYAAFPPY